MSYHLTLADVPERAVAAAARPALEQRVLAAKRIRRLALGPNMTLLFENRLTCLWQVLEMVRVEHISAPAAIQHELDTYNQLLPGPNELSITLLIEYPEAEERAVQLTKLVGLHQHLWLQLDGLPPIAVRFDDEQFNNTRVSSVQFLRVPLDAAALAALGNLSRPAAFVCDHPAYGHRGALSPSHRAALVEDLQEAT